MKAKERRVCLSVLAHPDDAEILCAGTMIRLAREFGFEIHIATITAGDCGTTSLDPWTISQVRTAEARNAAKIIGATYHCLGERDGMVFYEKATSQKVIDLFRRICPTIAFAHPRQDYMLDHEEAHLLARAASFVYTAPNISSMPLAASAAVPHLYYCDPLEGHGPLGQIVRPTRVVDISAVHETKRRMLACHASQREWLRVHHGIDEYLDAMARHDSARGKLMGYEFGEAFVQHLGHAYPATDLLSRLFPSKREKD